MNRFWNDHKFFQINGHTLECHYRTTIQNAKRKRFDKKHPDLCHDCDGWGVVIIYDSVPYGMTNVPLESTDECRCTYEERCPFCGVVMPPDAWDDDDYECECGWTWHDGPPEQRPHYHECNCYVNEPKYYLRLRRKIYESRLYKMQD